MRLSTGSWTKRLITDIEAWCLRKHGDLDFHMMQILSGHECFGQYLQKIKKEVTSKCHHCAAQVDSAERTLFECQAWEDERRKLRCTIRI